MTVPVSIQQPQRLTWTPAEARVVLGIGRNTMNRLLREGLLPSIKVGRKRLILRSALVDFMAGIA